MGRTRTPAFRLLIDAGGPNLRNTPMCWFFKERGRPTEKNLARYVEAYMRSLETGGSNAHLAREFGFIPYPSWARIVKNDGSGLVVAEWKAPMFMAVGPLA